MAHYLIANLNGGCYGGAQILSEAGIAELHRGVAVWNVMGILIGHYGMGWINQEFDATRIISHSGDVPDFGAFMALVPAQKKGLVLLFNANHAMLKLTKDEVGLEAARRLAGITPNSQILGFAPWLMRSLLLIPVVQIAGILGTLRLDPADTLTRGRIWRPQILINDIPNLLIALTLVPMLGKMRGFMRLFMPDFSWIAMICGSFAAAWTFLRTGQLLKALLKYSASSTQKEYTNL